MAKRNDPAAEAGGSGRPETPAYAASDIEEMERMTLEKANRTLSAIENAMAVWESSEEKPEDLKPRIARLRQIYEALANWEKKMLQSMAKKEDMDARVSRLREFSDICYAYA